MLGMYVCIYVCTHVHLSPSLSPPKTRTIQPVPLPSQGPHFQGLGPPLPPQVQVILGTETPPKVISIVPVFRFQLLSPFRRFLAPPSAIAGPPTERCGPCGNRGLLPSPGLTEFSPPSPGIVRRVTGALPAEHSQPCPQHIFLQPDGAVHSPPARRGARASPKAEGRARAGEAAIHPPHIPRKQPLALSVLFWGQIPGGGGNGTREIVV